MAKLSVFRQEMKYIINPWMMYNIRDKLKDVLKVDRSLEGYEIRSLYFDSINNIDYYDKLAGVASRKKVRLRIYDGKSDFIKLELKGKKGIYQKKESLIIDKSTANEIINGNYDVLLNYKEEIAKKIYLIMREGSYIPKSIIEYKRIAFVSNINTRITLDFNIKTVNYSGQDFFADKLSYNNSVEKDKTVLEIKFNNYLERYIGDLLSSYIGINQSVSKYVIGRKI